MQKLIETMTAITVMIGIILGPIFISCLPFILGYYIIGYAIEANTDWDTPFINVDKND